jgi:hypothetical protein
MFTSPVAAVQRKAGPVRPCGCDDPAMTDPSALTAEAALLGSLETNARRTPHILTVDSLP